MAVSKILYVLLVYIFVQNSNDGWLVLICWSSANIVATSISYIMLKKEGFEIKVPDIRSVFRELAQSSGFFWSRIAVVFYTSLGSVLVGTISLSQAAMYTSAEQIYKAGQAVTQPITQALYPYMAKEKDWKLFYGILTKALIILVIGVGIVYIGRNYLVQTAFGDGFEDAVPILSIFLMINIINFLGVNFGYPAFAAMSRTDIANNSVILGCVYFITHISVVYNLEKLSGINVAYAVLATEILVMAVRVTYFLKLKYK